jgi:hypothetical protein
MLADYWVMKILALIVAVGVWLGTAVFAQETQLSTGASIAHLSVHGEAVLVTVRVPAGKRRITLESRARLGRGTWLPRDVKWTDGAAGELVFRLPPSAAEAELLRVRDEAETELALPAGFFEGVKTFDPVVNADNRSQSGPVLAVGMDFLPPGMSVFDPEARMAGPVRSVVESDIWKVEGRTVYFFNQQRGLEVIDVSEPDAPRLQGRLPLAVSGEQLYRLPADTGDGIVWLALLAQGSCDGNSEVIVVGVRDGQPTLAGRVALSGSVQESRLVGDVLYTANFRWIQPEPVVNAVGNLIWQPGQAATVVSGLDLADPRQPALRTPVELAAQPNAIHATDRRLFVATTGTRLPSPTEKPALWAVAGNEAVVTFDISDPRGEVRQSGAFLTAGRVDSKFKFGPNGEVLAIVSEAGNTGRVETVTRPETGETFPQWVWEPPRAVLETFDLANPAEPRRLAELTLVNNQSVFGTRFVGDRVYVVTFLRVDPLWIVDLSNPAQPRIQGRLEVPGWSNYLHPLGDQLLAVGVEGGRAALSLFDVKDAAKPSLLSKVLLGEGWSWTEAGHDEKALAVLPEAGLVLMPWSGQRKAQFDGWFSGMQLVDYDAKAGTLQARGVIDHSFAARRATLIADRVISLAGDALLSADIADRDHPSVRAELPLTHQTDRVFVVGDRLLQLASWPSNRVVLTRRESPETPLATLPLLSLPVIGMERKGDRLFVLQHQPESFRYEEARKTNVVITTNARPSKWVWLTNEVVTTVPQPPLTNLVRVWREVEIPPTPDAPGYLTNKWVWSQELTPQPDLLVTNAVVQMRLEREPRLETNVFVNTEWRQIPVPAESAFTAAAWAGDRLTVIGRDRTPLPAGVGNGQLAALWTDPQTLVWTESAAGFNGWFDGPVPAIRSGLGTTDAISPRGMVRDRGWWGGSWRSAVRSFLAFDVSLGGPRLLSSLRLADTNSPVQTNGWTEYSDACLADGRIFVSERRAASVVPPGAPIGFFPDSPVWWQSTFALRVIDFSEPTQPVDRPPVTLPAELVGVSHGGQLLYTRQPGSAAMGDQAAQPAVLSVLGYDGVSASLVTRLSLGAAGRLTPVAVRPDGRVLLGEPKSASEGGPVLETWRLGTGGEFLREASLPTGTPVSVFREFTDVLVAQAADRYLFLSLPADSAPALTGWGDRPCSLWSPLEHGDAQARGGLWLPRGAWGVWHVPPVP